MARRELESAELSAFCGSVAMMLRAGMPMQEAVAVFAEDAEGRLARAAEAVGKAMEEGASFADGAEQTKAFPDYAVGMFRTAELSGRLDETLDRLADYYERQTALLTRLRSTLVYPVILLLMMCVVLAVLVFTVLPVFEEVYEGLTGSLAASAYSYVSVAGVIGRVSLIAAGVICVILLALVVCMKGKNSRQWLMGLMERLWLTKEASMLLAVSQMTDTVATMLASGADTDTTMRTASALVVHRALKQKAEACVSEMEQGIGLASAMFRQKVFPPLYGRMLLGGENSGNLELTMARLAERMGKEAETKICTLIDTAEPVLIGFLTLSVGLTLLCVMLPLIGILGAI